MNEMIVAPVVTPAPLAHPVFPPIYYDQSETQVVLGFEVTAADQLTAVITAGAPYFRVSTIDVCDWVTDVEPVDTGVGELPRAVHQVPSSVHPQPPRVTRHLSDPVATSDGVKPLAVKTGQFARLWVTANVPKGSPLSPGGFAGIATLLGNFGKSSANLSGTYLGPLIGKVVVAPQTAAPGQPVAVQVCDAQGKPVADPRVTVTIQGVAAASRYLQYAAPGKRILAIRASRGASSETAEAAVNIQGQPMMFRESLGAPPLMSLPIINAARVHGHPYAATLRLGNTTAVRRIRAAEIAKAAAAHPTAPAHAPPAPAPSVATASPEIVVPPATLDAFGTAVRNAITALPADTVKRFAPLKTVTAKGTATASATIAAIPHLAPPAPVATTYKWDFGDGTTATTQSPVVMHDFFPAIRAGRSAQSFDVTCTAVHDNVTVKRTVTVHSAYDLCRRTGIIVPHVSDATYATFQHVAFTASLIVHNLEDLPLTLTQMAFVPISDDPAVLPQPPRFVAMAQPIRIAANGASALGIYVPLSELRDASRAPMDGFTVIYTGQMAQADGSSVPVRFTRVLRISLADARRTGLHLPAPPTPIHWPVAFLPANWDIAGALTAVSGLATKPGAAVSTAGAQTLDPATRTVAIPLSADPHSATTLMQVHTATFAGMTHIALKTGVLSTTAPVRPALPLRLLAPLRPPSPPPAPVPFDLIDPLHPPPVAEGNECFPDDIPDADAATASAQQLVCQLTNETKQATIPAAFQNAQAGDIILSPSPIGDGDLISALFRALNPPQHHGHSGIMTSNFYEITHCTASVDRIQSNLNTDALGIPTSLNAQYLQYGWPGSITQSIDDTIQSRQFKSPEGTVYQVEGFNTDAEGQDTEIIPPLVVKPLPENDAVARPKLREVADIARSKGAIYDQNGNMTKPGGCYYSFYSYTKPERAEGFTDAAGPDGGWAKGLVPAVCSAFVWMAGKANGLGLVTNNADEKLSDFSPAAVAGGARVGSATKDGLIYYPADERLAAANALRSMLLDQALSKEYGLGTIPGIDDAIAGPIADQLLNCFAFGNANKPGDSSWKNPSDGNAVSPDNIIWWNPPYYGYAEPLQFLPRHDEQYTVSRWKKVVTWGTIKGRVTANGAPVANAHVWVYLPGGDAWTAADGTFTLNHVPIGTYALKAQGVVQDHGISAEYTNDSGDSVTLTAANSNITHDIVLHGAPVNFRRMDATFSLTCDHGDANPFNTHGVQSAGPYFRQVTVNPGQLTNGFTYTYDYNGGGYFHIDYQWSVALLADLSLEVTLTATMRDDGSGDFQTQYTVGPFNVPMGTNWSGWIEIEHSGSSYHNGPAHMTFTVTNNQQTG